MKKKTLPVVACLVSALLLSGCIQITNTVGNQPVPPAEDRKEVKSKSKAVPDKDYTKIKQMIATAIAEAIERMENARALPLEMFDIPYGRLNIQDGAQGGQHRND